MSEQAVTGTVELTLLGGFEVRNCGSARALPTVGQRVLALLALNPGPLSRRVVAGLLWPEASENSAGANLRTALWRIRDCDGELVDCHGTHLGLRDSVSVDVRAAVTEARTLVRPGPVAALPEAVTLDGDLLPGWYDDWVLLERERLHQLRLHALEALAERLLAGGRPAEAVDIAYRAVALEPLRESARCALIRALLHEGNAREARQVYGSFAQLLQQELGVLPGARLRSLIEA